ncbi:MAG: hypothetical protein WBF53_10205 [Litorimonas sp.]
MRLAGAFLLAGMLLWLQLLAHAHAHAPDHDHSAHSRISFQQPFHPHSHPHPDEDPDPRACALCIVATSEDEDGPLGGAEAGRDLDDPTALPFLSSEPSAVNCAVPVGLSVQVAQRPADDRPGRADPARAPPPMD